MKHDEAYQLLRGAVGMADEYDGTLREMADWPSDVVERLVVTLGTATPPPDTGRIHAVRR